MQQKIYFCLRAFLSLHKIPQRKRCRVQYLRQKIPIQIRFALPLHPRPYERQAPQVRLLWQNFHTAF